MLLTSARLRLLLLRPSSSFSSLLSSSSSSSSSSPFKDEADTDGSSSDSIPPLSSSADTSPASPAPTQESVLYVLKKLDKKPQKALSFFRCLATQHAFSPGPAAHSLMLRILGASPDHLSDFWSFLRSMRAAGHALDQGTYATLLAHFRKHKMAAEATALTQFRTAAARQVAADDAVRLAATAVLECSSHWSEDLEKKLQEMELPISEITVAKVVREVRDHPLKALGFFRWAGRKPGYKNASIAYNGMVRVLGNESSIEEFWSLIRDMKAEGHEIDIDTYIKVTRHFLKSRMLKEAVELYELMMDGPYKPAVQDCGMLLRQIALSRTPELDLVYRVVHKYEAAGHSLSKVVYDGIHRSLTSVGKFDDAEEIIRKMKLEGHEPDNITYSQLVYGLCKSKRLDDACKVLDDMQSGGCCTPDLKTWTVLIQGHCTAGEVDKALELLVEMIIKRNYEADADVLDILVKGLCSKDRAAGANTLIVEMVRDKNLRPWQSTYKYLIQELLKARMLEEALKVLSLMKSHNFPPFQDPFPPYISKHGTTEDAGEFLKALTVAQYPSPTAYLKVLESFFKEGRYSEAQDLLFKCPYHIRKHADICKLFDSMKNENAS